jgi:thioredoxin-like negative regulator of GroEL
VIRGVVAALLIAATLPAPAAAAPPLDAARALLARYHLDSRQLEQARDVLQAAPQRDTDANVAAVLAQIWFLIGEFRSRTEEARIAAYENGREVGRRAISLAPQNESAHVWYALNSGRLAETRGLVRSAAMVPTLRQEAETILKLNPDSVDGHTLAGGLAAELPAVLGGDRRRAEWHFRKALEADPRRTWTRIELARLYIATRRYGEAAHELQLVVDETAASDLPYWALRDLPRARMLLDSLGGHERRESP